jgi:hypothetical protein
MTVDPRKALFITGTPKVFRGKVVIGNGGTEWGPARGYATAYDAETGAQVWRFWAVPGNPADGFENEAMEMAEQQLRRVSAIIRSARTIVEGGRSVKKATPLSDLIARSIALADAANVCPDVNIETSLDLDAMTVERCPVIEWHGETFGTIRRRLAGFQMGDRSLARSPAEAEAFRSFGGPVDRDGEFLLHLLRRYDRALRWWFVVGNDRPEILKKLLFHPHMLPGFNDSGAHLINLAFFDGNLLTLKMAARESLAPGRYAVMAVSDTGHGMTP